MEELEEELNGETQGKHSDYLDDLEENSWSYTQQGTWADLDLHEGDTDE